MLLIQSVLLAVNSRFMLTVIGTNGLNNTHLSLKSKQPKQTSSIGFEEHTAGTKSM